MESLTKQNFWNDLMEKYPDEVVKFCRWIDEYKDKHAWVLLFSGDQIKYHDLPIAMQIGIFTQYVIEYREKTPNHSIHILPMQFQMEDYPNAIREWFRVTHNASK